MDAESVVPQFRNVSQFTALYIARGYLVSETTEMFLAGTVQ